jgi:hypothetical protein
MSSMMAVARCMDGNNKSCSLCRLKTKYNWEKGKGKRETLYSVSDERASILGGAYGDLSINLLIIQDLEWPQESVRLLHVFKATRKKLSSN